MTVTPLLLLLCACFFNGATSFKFAKARFSRVELRILAQRSSVDGNASRRDRMLSRTLEKMEHKRISSTESLPPLQDEPLLPMVETAVRASDDRKAGNILALRLSHLSEIVTFMVLAEGNSRPQIQAIANSIEDELILGFNETPAKQVVPYNFSSMRSDIS